MRSAGRTTKPGSRSTRQALQRRLAVIEHPAQASSWRLPETRRLLANKMAVQCSYFDQCLLGLVTQMANGRAAHPQKNLPDVKLALHRQGVQLKMHGSDMQPCAKHSCLAPGLRWVFVALPCSPSLSLAVREQMLNGWLPPATDSESDVEMPEDQN